MSEREADLSKQQENPESRFRTYLELRIGERDFEGRSMITSFCFANMKGRGVERCLYSETRALVIKKNLKEMSNNISPRVNGLFLMISTRQDWVLSFLQILLVTPNASASASANANANATAAY